MGDDIQLVALIGGGAELRITAATVAELGQEGLARALARDYTPGDLGTAYLKGGLWRIPVHRRNP